MPVDSFLKEVENSVRQSRDPNNDPKFNKYCAVSAECLLDISVPNVRNALVQDCLPSDTIGTKP